MGSENAGAGAAGLTIFFLFLVPDIVGDLFRQYTGTEFQQTQRILVDVVGWWQKDLPWSCYGE